MTALLRAPPEADLLDLHLASTESVQDVGGGLEDTVFVVHLPASVEAGERAHAIPATGSSAEAGRGLPKRRIRGAAVAPDHHGGNARDRIRVGGDVPADGRPLGDGAHPQVVHLGRDHHIGGTRLRDVREHRRRLARPTLEVSPGAVLVDPVPRDLLRPEIDARVGIVAVRGVDHESARVRIAGEDLPREHPETVAIRVLVERDVEAVVGHAIAVLVHAIADLEGGHARRRTSVGSASGTGVPGLNRARRTGLGGHPRGPGRTGIPRRSRHRVGVDVRVGVGIRIGVRVGVTDRGRTRGGGRVVLPLPGRIAAGQHDHEQDTEQAHHRSPLGLIV